MPEAGYVQVVGVIGPSGGSATFDVADGVGLIFIAFADPSISRSMSAATGEANRGRP
jgi:hypothetical protein